MDDVAQTVQPVVYSGLQNYQCFYQFKIINCQKLSIFISILYQLKLSILKIINYLLSILYQFLYQSSSKIINISKLSILKIHNSGEGIGLSQQQRSTSVYVRTARKCQLFNGMSC